MNGSYLDSGDIKLNGTCNNQPISQIKCLAENARMRLAISSFFSSKAKWPASSRWISASGRSRLNASAHSLPIFLSLETDHKKSRGIDWSQSRRHTSFAPSKARKLPCSRKISRVDDSRIRVSTRICHSFRDGV